MAITQKEINTLLETEEYERRIKAVVKEYRSERFYDDQEYDDLVQVAYLAVIDLLIRRDTTDGLRRVYKNAILSRLREENRKTLFVKIAPKHFKEQVKEVSQISFEEFGDGMVSTDDESLTTQLVFDGVMDSLTDDQQNIVRLKLAGHNKCEIARMLGLKSRNYVDRQWKKIEWRFAEHFGIGYDD